jgi:hypothetical protein
MLISLNQAVTIMSSAIVLLVLLSSYVFLYIFISDIRATQTTREPECFASEAIACAHCATRTLANGTTQHFPVALTPVVVAPHEEAVFPLPPQFVEPQDGRVKSGL